MGVAVRKIRSSKAGPFYRLSVALVALLFLATVTVTYGIYYYNAPGPLAEPTTVVFKKGMGFIEIVNAMSDQGIITNQLAFKAIAVTLGDARKFKAGEYRFSAAISPRLIMDMIAEGRVVVHKITVAEGLTVRDVMMLLNNESALEGAIVGDVKEGSLLPNTYHFVYGDSKRDLIDRMQAGMKTTTDELWPKRKEGLPFTTLDEAITLASIVEKETSVDSERGRIASVYINRLRKGMKLQADPTVIYGVEQGSNQAIGHALTGTDLRTPTPYNTYTNVGLPPGPIANPGRASIEAVLNPPETDELYFVATGSGGHNFSATLEGHNKNVASYRKLLNEKSKQEKKN
jgi:UPF0755 protein